MQKPITSGRLGRLAKMAALGARTGGSMLLGGDGASGAEAAAEVLGSLRGLAAKIGQMGSYVDGIVPEKQREAYENSLRMLRAQAPRSSTPEIRAFVEAELRGTIESLFLEWNDEPIASASIGQVHAAKLLDGTEVAVKVQHPKVRQAVESDLKNAGMLETFAGAMGGRRFDSKGLLEVVRARFREELDYRLEGTRIQDFARIHASDPTIRIPRLIEDRSSGGVLTTEFVRGLDFEEACAASENERRAWAETMWRFVFKGILVGGMFNADPHPGNYIFQKDGKVVFLDFGCVQLIP
ncbi:MAG: AarF/ABC1/UbiB kinase family protein, partial [Polyangiaceae bacterium]